MNWPGAANATSGSYIVPTALTGTNLTTTSASQNALIVQQWNNYLRGLQPAVQQMNIAFQNLGTAITQTASTINMQLWPVMQQINANYTGYTEWGTGVYGGTGGTGNIRLTEWMNYVNGVMHVNGQPLTPEQQLARERRDRAYRKQRRDAARRGAKLLLRLLDEPQRREYASTRAFTMADKNGRIFRLRKGRTAELLDLHGNVVASFCIHLYGGYVDEDTLICQKMMLEDDPAEFDKIANISWFRKPPAPVAPAAPVVPLRRAA